MKCRLCQGSDIAEIVSLGSLALPYFPKMADEKVPHAPLNLVRCDTCGLVQLSETVDRDSLFKDFWYRSAISTTITADLKEIASLVKTGKEDVVVDIGANDGTLLRFLKGFRVGYEPAANLATSTGIDVMINDYFSTDTYEWKEAKLITAIGMFYDLEQPKTFLGNVASILRPDGTLIVQQNYLRSMILNLSYDNICHEHLTYFSLSTMMNALEDSGLEVYDASMNEVNGGSFRTLIGWRGNHRVEPVVEQMLKKEDFLNDMASFDRFRLRVAQSRTLLRSWAESASRPAIYGAGTRGATILQYCLADSYSRFVYALDNNPDKHGHYYLDTHIPIISHQDAVRNWPSEFLLLPYHLGTEIMQSEREWFPGITFTLPILGTLNPSLVPC